MDIGDVVHLKSGGAAMTVQAMEAPPTMLPAADIASPAKTSIVCMWHDEAGEPRVERYDERMLTVKAHAKEAPAPAAAVRK